MPVLAAAAIVALSLAGCSGSEPATPKVPGTKPPSGSAGASAGALKDESAAMLSWAPPAPVAVTKGRLRANPSDEMIPATAEIISVQSSDASTILTWQLSSATDIPLQGRSLQSGQGRHAMPDAVRLIDPVAKKSYAVNTMSAPGISIVYCVCSTYPVHVGPDPVRMTAEYPALPAGLTSISVRIPNFAPMGIAVTQYQSLPGSPRPSGRPPPVTITVTR